MTSSSATSPQCSLFVGGVFPNVSHQELSTALNSVAKIKSLKIIRDSSTGLCKGYAFLTVQGLRNRDILLHTPFMLRDRELICQTRGQQQSKHIRKAKRVFVGKLAPFITNQDLHQSFER